MEYLSGSGRSDLYRPKSIVDTPQECSRAQATMADAGRDHGRPVCDRRRRIVDPALLGGALSGPGNRRP